MSFRSFVNAVRIFTEKNRGDILIGMGVAGFLGTTILAIGDTVHAVKKVEERKAQVPELELHAKDILKIAAPSYIRTGIGVVGSSALIFGGCKVNRQKVAGLAAVCTASDIALTEYRDKVKDILGEKKAQEIDDKVMEEKIQRTAPTYETITITGKGDTLIFDELSGRYFKSDINTVKSQINDLNAYAQRCSTDIFKNDYYDAIGLEPTPTDGDIFGWKASEGHIVDMKWSSHTCPDGSCCSAIGVRDHARPVYLY